MTSKEVLDRYNVSQEELDRLIDNAEQGDFSDWEGCDVVYHPHLRQKRKAVSVSIDEELILAIDRIAKKEKRNRSYYINEGLRRELVHHI